MSHRITRKDTEERGSRAEDRNEPAASATGSVRRRPATFGSEPVADAAGSLVFLLKPFFCVILWLMLFVEPGL